MCKCALQALVMQRTNVDIGWNTRKISVIQQMKLSRNIEKSVKTVHFDGFDHFHKAQKFVAKFFWMMLFAFSLICVFYEIYRLIWRYNHIPVITTISTRLATSMQLPTIEICLPVIIGQKHLDNIPHGADVAEAISRSMMSASPVEIHRILTPPNYSVTWASQESEELFQAVFPDERTLPFAQILELNNTTETVLSLDLNDMNKVYKMFMQMGFSIREVFLECMFYNNIYKRLDCEDIITEIFNPRFGKCFLIPPGKLKQTFPGEALMLFIDSQVSNYPASEFLRQTTAGLTVVLHHQYLYAPYTTREVHVQPGMFNKITILPEYHKYLSTKGNQRIVERRSCTSDDEGDLSLFLLNYTISSCVFDVVQRTVIAHCNCYLPQDQRFVASTVLSLSRMCSLFDVHHCVIPKIHLNDSVRLGMLNSLKRCSARCNFWKYSTRVSTMHMHKPFIDYFLRKNLSLDDVVLLQIAFEDLRYTALDQQWATDIHGLISDVGGQVGLWIGGCMVTIIQLLIVVCIAVVNYFIRMLKQIKIKIGE
ncbi:unnamed protein product [Soboliphyme baturini]|uniref:Amiloride-sensitive cation channel 5 n=1 Tax=Soboliphyme baturini TaxID=241478 RepID=A0A183IIR2_9BILA|nr:unnamed protein product [Soboliphyme baturini]